MKIVNDVNQFSLFYFNQEENLHKLYQLVLQLLNHYHAVIKTNPSYSNRFKKYKKLAIVCLSNIFKKLQAAFVLTFVSKPGLNFHDVLQPILSEFQINSTTTNESKNPYILNFLRVIFDEIYLIENFVDAGILEFLVKILVFRPEKQEPAENDMNDSDQIALVHSHSQKLSEFTSQLLHKFLAYQQEILNLKLAPFKSILLNYFSEKLEAKSKLTKFELDILIFLKDVKFELDSAELNVKIAKMLLLQVTNSRKDEFKVANEDNLLLAISGLISPEEVDYFLPEFIKLLAKIRDSGTKFNLIKCFEALEETWDNSLSSMIKQLNKYDSKIIGEIDLITRVDTYNLINKNLKTLPEHHLKAILSQCQIDLKMSTNISLTSIIFEILENLKNLKATDSRDADAMQDSNQKDPFSLLVERILLNATKEILKLQFSPEYFQGDEFGLMGDSKIDLNQTAINKNRNKKKNYNKINQGNDQVSLIKNWPNPLLRAKLFRIYELIILEASVSRSPSF